MNNASLRTLSVLLTCLVVSTLLADQAPPEAALPALTGKRWLDMNYGPYLTATIETPRPTDNFAYKGLAIRVAGDTRHAVGSDECATYLFDTDLLRPASAWSGDFLEMTSVPFNGRHGTGSHPVIAGEPIFVTRVAPGWGRPGTDGDFKDPREIRHGPLPADWARFSGLYLHEEKVILAYTVGQTRVLELPGVLRGQTARAVTRTLEIGPTSHPLTLEIADQEGAWLGQVPRANPALALPIKPGTTRVRVDEPFLLLRDPREAPAERARLFARIKKRQLNKGLLAHWACDEKPDAQDITTDEYVRVVNALGEKFSGTLKGVRRSVSGYRNGLNGCLWFYDKRSQGGVAFVNDAAELDLGTDAYTIAAWVKTGRGGALFTRSGKEWGAGSKCLSVRDGKLEFETGEGAKVCSKGSVTDRRWHPIAFSFTPDSRELRLYIDGALDTKETLSGIGADPEGSEFRLGYTALSYPQPHRYIGLLDELRIYGRVLADREVAALGSLPTANARESAVAVAGDVGGLSWRLEDGSIRVELAASEKTRRIAIAQWRGVEKERAGFAGLLSALSTRELAPLTRGGPARWPAKPVTRGKLGESKGAYAVDLVTPPMENPWHAWMRFGGFDFLPDGRIALGTWSGDVWIVDGVDEDLDTLTWHRIATGLFQPLGLKVVDGKIYVLGRDQITILRDLNGDGETDFYENFNNHHTVTEHFHEFAMALQTDDRGDFYYTKGARHGKRATLPRHGSVIRVSKDGRESEMLAYGFRASNGLCVNSDGTFIASDQQGNWMPANRINLVRRGRFYGYMWCLHPGEPPTDYDLPICWLHPEFDNSPSEQLWVKSDRWGPLEGKLLTLSYGQGWVGHVLTEEIDGQIQGGVVKLPLPLFPTGIMRARFSPKDGQLYIGGMFGWGTKRTYPGGFYRVRYTGKELALPLELHTRKSGVSITFTTPLDARRAASPKRYSVERWNYLWAETYGSKDYRVSDGELGRDRLEVRSVTLSDDGKTVFLEIPDMRPCMQMKIAYRLKTASGARLSQEIYQTIHKLGDDERDDEKDDEKTEKHRQPAGQ